MRATLSLQTRFSELALMPLEQLQCTAESVLSPLSSSVAMSVKLSVSRPWTSHKDQHKAFRFSPQLPRTNPFRKQLTLQLSNCRSTSTNRLLLKAYYCQSVPPSECAAASTMPPSALPDRARAWARTTTLLDSGRRKNTPRWKTAGLGATSICRLLY